MNDSKRKITSIIFGSGMIILIIISFMFTGSYDSFQPTADTVAKVGDQVITYRQYDNELKRQMSFYQQFMGGKALSKQQIEQFRLKENAIKNLVQRTLLLEFGKSIGISVAHDEIIKEIKSQAYFQTNKQFDINKYKQVLKFNQYTPEQWEGNTGQDILREKVSTLFDRLSISKVLANEIKKYKDMKKNISVVQIDKAKLRSKLPVSKQEIKSYLGNKENKEQVKKLFEQRKSSLAKPEQINAHHILLKTDGKNDNAIQKKIDEIHSKLTTKNFADMANKHSEDSNIDPQTKVKKGGSLGWFGRGRMVPPFEKVAFNLKVNGISKPVKTQFGYHIIWVKDKKEKIDPKLENFEDKIAIEQIRNAKGTELDKFLNKVTSELQNAFSKNRKNVESLAKKYDLVFEKDITINRLEGHKGKIALDTPKIKDIFDQKSSALKTFSDPSKNLLVYIEPYVAPKEKSKEDQVDEKLDLVRKKIARLLSRKLRENILDSYKQKLSIHQNDALL